MPKVMISAAEVSGDVHASYLVREIRKQNPSISFFGIGGEQMRSADVDVRIDITSKSTIGIFEVLKHIPSHIKTIKRMKKMMDTEKPDVLILVDAQGFNMPLASIAKSKNIRTVYYIAPQEWLWGTEKGSKKVSKVIDLIVSIFKKEDEIYKKVGANSVYFGHPLIDIAVKKESRDGFVIKYAIGHDKKIISLCPGSRSQEVNKFFPILIETAKKIRDKRQGVEFVLPLSSSVFRDEIDRMVKSSGISIKVIEGDGYNVLGNSDLAISVSGTVVLDSAILGIPTIMFYKLSKLTYLLAKYVLKVKLPYYSMPNILENKMIVPEFIMDQANSDNLSSEALLFLDDEGKRDRFRKEVSEMKVKLGEKGVISRAAESILKFISN